MINDGDFYFNKPAKLTFASESIHVPEPETSVADIVEKADQMTYSKEAFDGGPVPKLFNVDENQPPDNDTVRCMKLWYVRRELSDTQAIWTVFLNVMTLKRLVMNDFVALMQAVRPTDRVLILGPAKIPIEWGEVIAGAICDCKSKDIAISSPYILNTPAAYILTFASYIVNSPYGIIQFDAPTIGAAGAFKDAQSGLDSELYRRGIMLNRLRAFGFLTDEQLTHIAEHQGKVALFGKKLEEVINKFNGED